MPVVKMLAAAGLIFILVWLLCHFLIVEIGRQKGHGVDMGRAGLVALFPAAVAFLTTVLWW